MGRILVMVLPLQGIPVIQSQKRFAISVPESDIHLLLVLQLLALRDHAVHTVQSSVQEIMSVINMIDSAMRSVKNDEFYPILELRYFNGMSQSEIANVLNCTQQNISYHKNRLVRELSLRIFPDEVAKELLQ